MLCLFSDKASHECDQCKVILEELENIDDDCDRHGITFVKTQVSYFIHDLFSLTYFNIQFGSKKLYSQTFYSYIYII